jgi:flagellar protein FlaG
MAVSLISGAHSTVSGSLSGSLTAAPVNPVVVKINADADAKREPPKARQLPVQLTLEQIKSSLQEFQQAVQKTAPGLELSIDEELGVTVVRFRDAETKEVVKQFPSEEMLDIAKSTTKMQGLLFSKLA